MRLGRAITRTLAALAGILLAALVIGMLAVWLLAWQSKTYQTEDRLLAAPKTGTWVAAGDARLFVQRIGDPAAPAIVFIHGTGSWSETWRASMRQAASLGYQAIAVDLPPFGYSMPPASGNYAKPAQANRILAMLDTLGIRQATFVAHSFGAAPVMEALLRAPQRASAVVLVDAALGLDSAQTDGRDNPLQALLRHRWLSEPISAAFLTHPAMTQTLLRSFISEKDKAGPEWVRLYQAPLAVAGSYRQVADWLPELVSSRGQDRSDQMASYRALPFPVTLIWGARDAITPLSQAQHLKDLMAGAKLIVIPMAGHIPQIEEPEQFHLALGQAIGTH
jgi:pimeloyl-ACP methyl ester carboxylesterase